MNLIFLKGRKPPVKAQHINPFLESTRNVFGMFQMSVQIGSPSLQESPFSGKDILTMVGVTGVIRGQIYLGLSLASALKIASVMMGGAIVTEFDSMAQSAVSELSNMICGNALTVFSQEGIVLDITPPNLIVGQGMQVAAVKMGVLSVPIHLDGMDGVEMNIALES
ncbi:chemotaxis protein CheX [Cohnella sp.]|uniref:chemotaxis protein CheX n=1 Tax=Cohnella sp. TaxID=1883426 RepID=UPI0035681325